MSEEKEKVKRGKFVIIEGGDCSGKSTFLRFLQETYSQYFVYTNEPGGCSYGRKIRYLLLADEEAEGADNFTKFLLYWGSKVENFKKVVRPNIDEGKIVISDRFEGSTYAYQISEDQRLERLFWEIREACLQGIKPIYLYFDVPVEIQIDRAKARNGEVNYFDVRGIEYRKKINAAYQRFFRDRRIEFHRVDASLPKKEMVQSAHAIFKGITGL